MDDQLYAAICPKLVDITTGLPMQLRVVDLFQRQILNKKDINDKYFYDSLYKIILCKK
jgi:hypothetical protein